MSAASILEDNLFRDILRAVLVAGWAALLLGLGLALLQEQPGLLDASLPDINERVLDVAGMLLIGLASGALAGMATGALTVVVWANLEGGIFEVYEILPGFLAGLAANIFVSLLGRKPPKEEFETLVQN